MISNAKKNAAVAIKDILKNFEKSVLLLDILNSLSTAFAPRILHLSPPLTPLQRIRQALAHRLDKIP